MTTGMSELAIIAGELKRSASVLISVHKNPDGDALGSQLALMIALEKLGKSVTAHNLDPVPENYRFLPSVERITWGKDVTGSYDALVVMDCEPDRTGLFNGDYPGRVLLNIDHHPTNARPWQFTWLDSAASATGEMTYKLIEHLGVHLDPDIASCLYTAIFTDTGSFRYSNATPESMRISADLVEAGANQRIVTENVYESFAFDRLRLLGAVLGGMKRSDDGRIAWVIVTNEHYRATGTSAEDTDNFINFVRSVKGVEVAVLFRQTTDAQYKVSLRSKGRADISVVAQQFNGGGHKNAAGCVVDGTIEEITSRVIGDVEKALPPRT